MKEYPKSSISEEGRVQKDCQGLSSMGILRDPENLDGSRGAATAGKQQPAEVRMWIMKEYPKNSMNEKGRMQKDCQGLSSMGILSNPQFQYQKFQYQRLSVSETFSTTAQKLQNFSPKPLLSTGIHRYCYEKQQQHPYPIPQKLLCCFHLLLTTDHPLWQEPFRHLFPEQGRKLCPGTFQQAQASSSGITFGTNTCFFPSAA